MRVIFRVDASLEIGSGHLSRCKVLADVLHAESSASCIFVGRDPDGFQSALLDKSPHEFLELPEPEIASEDDQFPAPHSQWLKRSQQEDVYISRQVLGATWESADWLVIDHYGIDARWESMFHGQVLALDDLADRPHAADLVLDQNLRANALEDYRKNLARGTRILCGPRHALLREEFRKPAERQAVADLFIGFGGADAVNNTGFVLNSLRELSGVSAHVVISGRHPARSQLESMAAEIPGCQLHIDHPDIAGLMCASRLAIGAGGGMAWERCASGLPTLAWPVADNQRAQLLELVKTGALEVIPERTRKNAVSLAKLIRGRLDDESRLEIMSTAARQVCDGQGVHRVLRAMRANAITLRPAVTEDSMQIFEWRNHPDVRHTAFNTNEIKPEEHERWFAASLENPDRVMRVAEFETRPVGFLRFDRKARSAEVSIFLAPGEQGSGIGSALLHKAEREIPPDWKTEILHAGIREDNDISVRLFENAGYVKHSDGWQKVLPPVGSKQ